MNKIRISCYEHDIERANETIALQADLLLEECKKVDDYREELEEVENKKREIKEEMEQEQKNIAKLKEICNKYENKLKEIEDEIK